MTDHDQWSMLSAYLDGELSGPERDSVKSHVAACGSCRRELEALEETKAWAASAPRRALPPDLLAALDERFSRRSWIDALKSWRSRPVVWMPVGALATVAVAAALWTGLRGEQEYLPLEPLLAAHSRYVAEGLVPGELVASNFSAQLAKYHGEQQ